MVVQYPSRATVVVCDMYTVVSPDDINHIFIEKNMQNENKKNLVWIFKVLILTLFLSLTFSIASELVMRNSHYLIAFFIIILLILISILFDTIGTAVAACDEATFHAMASRNDKGAKIAVYFAQNRGRVNSVCGDIIGDICGIISGAAGSSIIVKLYLEKSDILIYSIILSGIIATLTITGKAIAKMYALKNADKVIMKVARTLAVFKKNS